MWTIYKLWKTNEHITVYWNFQPSSRISSRVHINLFPYNILFTFLMDRGRAPNGIGHLMILPSRSFFTPSSTTRLSIIAWWATQVHIVYFGFGSSLWQYRLIYTGQLGCYIDGVVDLSVVDSASGCLHTSWTTPPPPPPPQPPTSTLHPPTSLLLLATTPTTHVPPPTSTLTFLWQLASNGMGFPCSIEAVKQSNKQLLWEASRRTEKQKSEKTKEACDIFVSFVFRRNLDH